MLKTYSNFFSQAKNLAGQIQRTHVSFIGFMNAGKSSLMNAITQQKTSIVDSTPGTTADTKVSLMEIHSLGPCKLLDTAGINESGELGQKKLTKTFSAIKESDIVIFVIDPFNFSPDPFKKVFDVALRRKKVIALVFNEFEGKFENFEQEKSKVKRFFDSMLGKNIPEISVKAINQKDTNKLIVNFISSLLPKKVNTPLLPLKYLGPSKSIFLNTPLDIESPNGRLLKPQQMMLEFALRKESPVICFNMNLKKARSQNNNEKDDEYNSFINIIHSIKPSILVTDSQAIDIMNLWTPKEYPLTTFSVIMANVQSNNGLKPFLNGIATLKNLKSGDKVLICEACNHDRIIDDIGTVQIPTKLKKVFPNIEIDWAFGREYETKNLNDYALALHCGGCMISKQQMQSRLDDLYESGVPVSNYGLTLSWLASPDAFDRVISPFIDTH